MKLVAFWILFLAIVSLLMAFEPMAIAQQQTVKPSKPSSTIGYTLSHPLHTVQGISKQVSSELLLSQQGKQIERVKVSVPVRSFDSGNRRRDRDMLKVTEAERYPEVTFVSSEIAERDGALAVKGQLFFHGVTQEIGFTARQYRQGEDMVVEGGFEISLEQFSIKRPSILTMKVKDQLQVQFQMVY
ncbi:YceI family protein [uncultured Pontibacter sp.]|uniref:YceI family protein n=1 Tax=uncultured Pontibacter sp. TaxID=453356 RepID=UPI0026112B94|nr:YceI family protein [uncultured Pontibacter sp.]